MASTKEFKNRLKSITSIQKITKAMKMVAASKLRQAQRSCEMVRPFSNAIERTVSLNPTDTVMPVNQLLVIAITSDRGLCGGVNSSVVKFTKKMTTEFTSKNIDYRVVSLGEKGRDPLLREYGNRVSKIIADATKKPLNFVVASAITEELILLPFDQCTVVFNKFYSVISQKVEISEIASHKVMASLSWHTYEFEGDSSLLLNLTEFQMTGRILGTLLENYTSELGARMTAMDNASRNARDMRDRLTLIYNKARQAAITSELIDIISCAGAVGA